ncbi:hypothetical protein KHO57_gp178 [Mycobacterium phage Phabba]|uniref:Uncharacterized protein n=1 Tax=Mycobacterium phage Phabba TaxID=2027899 RepID=A0A249XSP5_9CAUD|nr:hypothetical protein KHO57_gp178 [Mycobacterium phage Phabba]ASZ74726.1 hypothetical protein SEA_PHABBA_187 [Mycobacterium phage Phabba]
MKAKDATKWADQELELKQDETGRRFLEFFDEWFTLAENLAEEVDDSGNTKRSAVSAVRHALLDVEGRRGYLAMEWIGQMLLLAEQNWVYGEAMERGLTVLERRMMEVMAAVKLVELQESASL